MTKKKMLATRADLMSSTAETPKRREKSGTLGNDGNMRSVEIVESVEDTNSEKRPTVML